METVYQRIIDVRIWHDYFLGETNLGPQLPANYQVSDFVTIRPTGDTQREMKRCRLLFKASAGGFWVFTEIKEGTPNQTLLKMKDPVKLSFVLSLTDPLFLNYTNVPLDSISNGLFYFSNLESNILFLGGNPFFFISRPIPAYSSTATYRRGDLTRGANEVFEVINTPVSAAPVAGAIQADWAQGKNTQYAGSQDIIARYDELYTYQSANTSPDGAAVFEVRDQFDQVVPLGNKPIPGETIPIEQTVFPAASESNFTYALPLQRLPGGRYTLYLNGNPVETFYKLSKREYPQAIAVVELFHLPLGSSLGNLPAGYKFINPGTDPANPMSIPVEVRLQIHFKSRLTRWQYISSQDRAVVHTTTRPLALSRSFTEVIFGGERLPNPSARSLKRETASDQLFSVVYL